MKNWLGVTEIMLLVIAAMMALNCGSLEAQTVPGDVGTHRSDTVVYRAAFPTDWGGIRSVVREFINSPPGWALFSLISVLTLSILIKQVGELVGLYNRIMNAKRSPEGQEIPTGGTDTPSLNQLASGAEPKTSVEARERTQELRERLLEIIEESERLDRRIERRDLFNAQLYSKSIRQKAQNSLYSLGCLDTMLNSARKPVEEGLSMVDNRIGKGDLPSSQNRVEKTIPSENELMREYNKASKGTDADRERFFEGFEFKTLQFNNPDLAEKGAGARLTGDVLFDEAEVGDLFRLIKTRNGWRLVPSFRIRFDSVGIVRFAFDCKEQPTRNGEGYCRIGEILKPATLTQKGERQWVLGERGIMSFEKPGSQLGNVPKNSTQGNNSDPSRSA